jgi:DNA polymerase III epsilon subunit-like protein
MDPVINHLIQLPWICGLRDVKEHNQFKSRRLSHLALEYGVTVYPNKLHRAYGDVELTREMLHAVPTTAEKMYEYQQIPWVVVKAFVTFDQKDLAKAQGYSWERVHGLDRVFQKTWCKRIKQTELEKELSHEFRVEQIA